MTPRASPLALLLLLAAIVLAPAATALTNPLHLDCDLASGTPVVGTLYRAKCEEYNETIDCAPPVVACVPCLNPSCVGIHDCPPPTRGFVVLGHEACVDPTPPTSAGTTCPAAYSGGKGVYLDYAPTGAGPEDRWACANVTTGGAPCAPGEAHVHVSSHQVPDEHQCVSTTPTPPCSTPGPGWGVGFGPSCLVHLPWAEPSPPAPTTCPPGTLAPVRVWWGNTPGFTPGSFTDVCAV